MTSRRMRSLEDARAVLQRLDDEEAAVALDTVIHHLFNAKRSIDDAEDTIVRQQEEIEALRESVEDLKGQIRKLRSASL